MDLPFCVTSQCSPRVAVPGLDRALRFVLKLGPIWSDPCSRLDRASQWEANAGTEEFR
jgi:hypothetical protein